MASRDAHRVDGVDVHFRHDRKAGRPCERALVDAALGFIDALTGSRDEQVLLHQDLHGHDVLAAERHPGLAIWLAIDPKPLVGERAFALAPVVRSFELDAGEAAMLGRLDRLSNGLGIDRDRALGWTVAQTMAWSFDGDAHHVRHHRTARRLLAAR